jgi:hypothetical protein
MIFMLCACQLTPKEGVGAQKNTERMMANAEKDGADAGVSLREQYGIPAQYTWEAQGQDGVFSVKADAPIVVPEGSAMPIVRVKAANFTQEQVSALWDGLVGDTEMWNVTQGRSKEQIAEEILTIKQLMTDEQKLLEELGLDTESAKEHLSWLEDAYQTAPEKAEATRADGTLREKIYYANHPEESGEKVSVYTGFFASENAGGIEWSGKSFSVENNNDLKESVVLDSGRKLAVNRGATAYYSDRGNQGVNVSYSGLMPVSAETELDDAMMNKTGLPPEDAIAQVQALLDSAGGGMTVWRASLLTDGILYDENGGIVSDEAQCSYKIECVRETDGVSCSYITDSSATGDQGAAGATYAYWTYEKLEVYVNKDGIYNMYWISPLEVTETVSEDAQLKPFSEIKDIFEEMIFVKYEGDGKYGAGAFNVDRVELSLHRITEQNSYEDGLLIPVWNFYGSISHDPSDAYYNDSIASFMSINAIDGAIIDTSRGY